ncbi:MAG TPA: metal ABC transporter ATP-binding protein [Spirochaetota bacterium]|nr:metal ABC transporter ATP-binding protein [Spirochaetota bacterium]
MIADNKIKRPVAVRFKDVSFSYGPMQVLTDVNFHIHHGDFIALVGPNGSGKTTILKLLLNLEKPDSGRITLFEGIPSGSRDHIGYVPQHADYDSAFPITVREVVRMGRLKSLSRRFSRDDEKSVLEAMNLSGISDLAGRSYSALSGGERRRVMVARALASSPLLLILDEPYANMDMESEDRLYKTLETLKGNTTVIIVTHDPAFVSSLTDMVLCVGEQTAAGCARTVVLHRTEPSSDTPYTLYGGKAARVRHNEKLTDASCCQEVKKK